MSVKKTCTLGIDPGTRGALAVFDFERNELVTVIDVPTLPKTKKYVDIDMPALGQFIGAYAERIQLAVIEEVGSRPGEGRQTVFNFGFAAGAVAMAVASYLIPVFHTPPGVWKPLMGLSRDKNLSRIRASAFFPKHAALFKRVMDDGRAEAALLAKFGERLVVKS